MGRTRAWWRGEVARWEESGKSAASFAVGKGYSPRTLTWYRSELRRVRPGESVAKVALVPARVVASAVATPIWIEIGGARLEVRAGFDPSLLRALIGTLREAR